MNINLEKFLSMAGFAPNDLKGKRDSTSFSKTGDNEWTFAQRWGRNTDTLVLRSFRQRYTRVQLVLHGRNPDDWIRLAECAKTLRRMTKTCVQAYDFCIDITYGQQEGHRELLKLYCEMVVEGTFDEKKYTKRKLTARKARVLQ